MDNSRHKNRRRLSRLSLVSLFILVTAGCFLSLTRQPTLVEFVSPYIGTSGLRVKVMVPREFVLDKSKSTSNPPLGVRFESSEFLFEERVSLVDRLLVRMRLRKPHPAAYVQVIAFRNPRWTPALMSAIRERKTEVDKQTATAVRLIKSDNPPLLVQIKVLNHKLNELESNGVNICQSLQVR